MQDSSRIPVEDLDEAEARAELHRLARDIAFHDKRYHQQDKPVISDAEYDSMRGRNAAIEARFPGLVQDDFFQLIYDRNRGTTPVSRSNFCCIRCVLSARIPSNKTRVAMQSSSL